MNGQRGSDAANAGTENEVSGTNTQASALGRGVRNTNTGALSMMTIRKQTGWTPCHPMQICQDFDVLAQISDYDFDLSNGEFCDYCESRGVLYKAGTDERFEFTANHAATKSEFCELFRFAETQPDGTAKLLGDDDLELDWEIMLSAKGSMQDCWELFSMRDGRGQRRR